MKRWLARLLLLFVSIALAFVVTEFSLRTFAPQPLNVLWLRPDRILLHVPNLDVILTGVDFRTRVRTNSAGLRDVERSVEKPAGVTRVLVLGDSMIEGLQVEFEETMPKRLEALLTEALPGRRFDVINAGVSGSSGPMARLYLEREGLSYDPDLLVVTITTRNDVQEAADTRIFPRPLGYELRVYLRSRFHLYGLVEKGINATPRLRNALAKLGILSHARPLPAAGGVSDEVYLYDEKIGPYERLGYQRLLEAYDAMIALCKTRRIPLLAVLIPSFYQATGYAAALGDPGRVGTIVKNDRAVQDWHLAFFKARGVEVLDLLPGMRQNAEEYYLPRDRHFTVAGNAFAAEQTVRAIVNMGFFTWKAAGPSPGE